MSAFTTDDIPDLSGKVIFVTGGTNGLGKLTTSLLAAHNPSHVFFSGRNTSRAEKIVSDLEASHAQTSISFIKCDLASFASVTQAAKDFLSQSTRLDILICNAGIMATPPALTQDGYEEQFGTNHMGHALLMKHLLPTLESTSQKYGDARIVSLTSLGFTVAPASGIEFETLMTTQAAGFASHWSRYGQSKLANILYAQQLAKHYPSITTASVHPGIVATDLVGSMGFWDRALVYVTSFRNMVTAEEGVKNSLWAATVDKKDLQSGGFYEPIGKIGRTSKCSTDEKLAEKLWTWTQGQMKDFII